VSDDAVGALDHIDFFGLVELTGHLIKVATTLGTGLVGFIEVVNLLFDRQFGLGGRSVAGLRLVLFASLGFLLLSPLAAPTEAGSGVAFELVLQAGHLVLEGIDIERFELGLIT
jgi:hypothetical protein